jgi:hypothetical protein
MPPGKPLGPMHGLDERHTQGKVTWIDEEYRGVALGAPRAAGRRSAMTWRMQFYHERRGILVRLPTRALPRTGSSRGRAR